MKGYSLIVAALALTAVSGKVYFEETFDKELSGRWVQSEVKDTFGKFEVGVSKKFNADEKENRGLYTSQDARNYAISAKLDSPIDNKDKDLVVQFTAKFDQDIDCGGGYIKLLPDFDPKKFDGDSKYNIMFGPDFCGSNRKVHAILNYQDKNVDKKDMIYADNDLNTHLYTFILHSDKTYEILIDNEQKNNGTLLEDWAFLPEKEIDDKDDKKPAEWVDDEQIDDPEDKKPADWYEGPESIPDPEAKKPEDWNDEDDGEWEVPTIPNPEYKGEWTAKRISNPAYKGEWKPKKIPNPEYKEDNTIGQYKSAYLGFDLWQVKAGTIFDNILVTDDVAYAKTFGDKHFTELVEKEKKALEDFQAAEKEKADAERKLKEEEEAKKAKEAEEKEEKEEKEDKDVEELDEDEAKVDEKKAEDEAKVDEKKVEEDKDEL